MFETVAPQRASLKSRSALYEALSFSLAAHGVAALFALGTNVWEVTFPSSSPVYTVAFVLEAPPPPPPPPPAAKPLEEKQPEMTTAKMMLPADMLAPTVIPDEIPIVKPQTIPMSMFASAKGVVGGIDSGVDQGIIGGTPQGEVGGKIGGVVGGVVVEPPKDGRVHIARDVRLPMVPLSQVYPNYPEDARMRAWEDELVVRYIIGKDGRVKEVTIISLPQHDVFVDGTLRAIRSWRFKPMIKDGERQEVVHELTVYYKLNQST